jgi:hypothetical protein
MKKLRAIIITAAALFMVGAVPVYAAGSQDSGTKCGDTKTQLIACSDKTGIGTISDLIKIAISVMTVLIGIVATGGIAYGALLYASAGDDQSKVSSGITIIRNVVIGILLYGFTIAIINWLIPGGVIG